MEHLKAKAGEPFYEADGAPILFAVGCYDGFVHLLRFGPEDSYYDVKKEAEKLRRSWGKGNRIDKMGQ